MSSTDKKGAYQYLVGSTLRQMPSANAEEATLKWEKRSDPDQQPAAARASDELPCDRHRADCNKFCAHAG